MTKQNKILNESINRMKRFQRVLNIGKAIVDHYAKTSFLSDEFESDHISYEVLSRAENAMRSQYGYELLGVDELEELRRRVKDYFVNYHQYNGENFLVDTSSGSPVRLMVPPHVNSVHNLKDYLTQLIKDPIRSYEGIAKTIANAMSATLDCFSKELKPSWDQKKMALDILERDFKEQPEEQGILAGVM